MMIDTFMVLWNRERKRKGVKGLCALLLICISISLLLVVVGLPPLFAPPAGRGQTTRQFSGLLTATTTAQPGGAAGGASARTVNATPTAVCLPCVSLTATATSYSHHHLIRKYGDGKKMRENKHHRRYRAPLRTRPTHVGW